MGKYSGKIRLHGSAMAELREQAYERSGAHCEIQRDGKRCNYPLTFLNMELAHIKSRGAGGSDTLDNVLCSCRLRADGKAGCHYLQHAGHPEIKLVKESQ